MQLPVAALAHSDTALTLFYSRLFSSIIETMLLMGLNWRHGYLYIWGITQVGQLAILDAFFFLHFN